MSDPTFTTEETGAPVGDSARVLWRFLREVPAMRLLIVPNISLALVTSAGFQLFVWGSAAYAECVAPCSKTVFFEMFTLSLGSLSALALAITVLRIIQWTLFESGGQIASLTLFRRMVQGVGGVRTTFFDEYPSGKIINRVVRDFDQLRVYAPIRIGDSFNALAELLVAAIVIGLANPFAGIVALPTLLVFLYIQSNVSPMLQRALTLRSARIGEVLHRETDVIEGVRSFLLYNQTAALFSRLRDAVYRYMQMHFLRGSIEAWGRFWSEVAVAIYGGIALVAVVLALDRGTITPVVAALVISAVFRLGASFGWLTWSLGFLFESVGHAKRVFEYVDLPHEGDEERSVPVSIDAVASAKLTGPIQFTRYTMSYRKGTPLILKDLTLAIPQGQKVGIVGRTGAGKTSLVQAMLRMVFVVEGDITVGGRSLFSISVDEARALFSVVPQDPYLFEGTLRSNVDRYDQFSDSVVQAALDAVQLSFDLGMQLEEGGGNISLGQRQLLCLARALLSDRPIVVMDEPTSGVDAITDAIMQQVLRTALKDKTVLTIAHRLETLVKVDRIIELQAGEVFRDGPAIEILPLLTAEEIA